MTNGGAFVKPAPFAYAKARSLDHAIELLGRHEGRARVLAGGQSLIATLNMRLDAPTLLVDINAIAGLDGITHRDGQVEIGALTRHAAAERSDVIGAQVPLMAKAMPHIGHPAIRNRGTIGGSIAFADPAAELPACLVALDGEVDIAGPKGRRTVQAGDFFKDLFETALGPQDVLTAIRIPAAAPARRVGFAEFSRRHGDYAMIGLAASATGNGGGLSDVRLAFFGVGATPVRARRAEAALASGRVDDALAALGQDLAPADDIQATGAVKKHLAGVLLKRVAAALMERPS
jgi:aerobic carbon-monoxide dehydrogenase medium subunit